MLQKPKKFDLIHQTVSPCERVGCGDETSSMQGIYMKENYSCKNLGVEEGSAFVQRGCILGNLQCNTVTVAIHI